MTKFDTINGQLCRMLEKPVPLTTDAKTPCIVRLIQDDSPMGRYNKWNYDGLDTLKKYSIVYDAKAESDDEEKIFCYEILGYPVVPNSAEWALYQIRSGNKVAKEGYGERYGSSFYENRLFYLNGCGCLVTKNGIGLIDPCSEEEFLSLDETGWQIYKESKPLLAEAKVGDLCECRDGMWRQIRSLGDSWGTDACLNPNLFCVFLDNGSTRNIYGAYLGTMANDLPIDIISTEPLAPEGSREWAWQMMLLGNKVTYGSLTDCYLLMVDGACEYRQNDNSQLCTFRRNKTEFLSVLDKTHRWHLYEPDHIGEANKKVETCPTCNGTGKVEKPAPAFKVGDWVTDGVINGNITSLTDDLAWVKTEFYEYRMSLRNLTPISSSEIVIHIGCLSGTVRSRDNKSFHLLRKGKNTMVIYFDALDTPTRELVRELIEKQEGDAK